MNKEEELYETIENSMYMDVDGNWKLPKYSTIDRLQQYAAEVSREMAKKAWEQKAHVDAVLLGDYENPDDYLFEEFKEWWDWIKEQEKQNGN